MANTELNNVSMDSIEDLTTVNVLGDIIINAINTITKTKKRPDETSIYEFLNKSLENANLTKITINERLTSMSNNNRITKKKTPPPKKTQLQIYRISCKTCRTSSLMNFQT